MKPLDALKALTPDALSALEKTGISRRQFMQGAGALIVGFCVAPSSAVAQTLRLDGAGSNRLDSWIAIGADGTRDRLYRQV